MFCGACWAEVPAKKRTAIATTWNAVRNRPTSPKARADYDRAIADAASEVT